MEDCGLCFHIYKKDTTLAHEQNSRCEVILLSEIKPCSLQVCAMDSRSRRFGSSVGKSCCVPGEDVFYLHSDALLENKWVQANCWGQNAVKKPLSIPSKGEGRGAGGKGGEQGGREGSREEGRGEGKNTPSGD